MLITIVFSYVGRQRCYDNPQTCENCLQTESCSTTMYFELNFALLFDEWILNGSSCELCRGCECNPFNLNHMCIKIPKNESNFVSDHHIRCPVCNTPFNLYYLIPVHTLSNGTQACNVEGKNMYVLVQ